jgi:hypothetical protein
MKSQPLGSSAPAPCSVVEWQVGEVERVDRAAAAVRGGTLPSIERLTPPFSPDLLRAFAADLMLNRPDFRIAQGEATSSLRRRRC